MTRQVKQGGVRNLNISSSRQLIRFEQSERGGPPRLPPERLFLLQCSVTRMHVIQRRKARSAHEKIENVTLLWLCARRTKLMVK